MHARESRQTEQRLNLLAARREASCYLDREWAVLARIDALARVSEGHRYERIYDTLSKHFTEEKQLSPADHQYHQRLESIGNWFWGLEVARRP